jgi:hypothetical protein
MLIESALFPRNLLSHLLRFHFITVPVPVRQKVTIPSVPVSQHCFMSQPVPAVIFHLIFFIPSGRES